ncbi:MAG: hypothetical protein AB7P04_01525 [Bacteriovoracia bacterium]
MKVLSVPARLKTLMVIALIALPLAALETIIVSRSPWLSPPWRSLQIWTLSAAFILAPLLMLVASGRRWALRALGLTGAIWCLLSFWLSIRTQNFWLSLFSIGLVVFWSMVWLALKHEMGRSFFDPGMKWFQGVPQAIPYLECEMGGSAFRVSRLDRDGTFVFRPEGAPNVPGRTAKPEKKVSLTFRFRAHAVECKGRTVTALESGRDRSRGYGIRFAEMNLDGEKRLGDFIELLRGEGYV